MASIEFIEKRIAGKEKELETLNKKMDRILKAKATNWEKNPHWYNERDIEYTQKDIDNAEKALQGYKDQLETELRKSQSRNIPAILEFLQMWKGRMMDFYEISLERYIDALKEFYAYDHEFTDWSNNRHRNGVSKEEYLEKYKEYKNVRNKFERDWSFITPYIDRAYGTESGKKYILNKEKIQKMLDQEANAKYDFIVERTCEIVGTITDASNLKIGSKGDLNGYIIGTDGTAKVETIGAGGYNIQCFHFRTLIKRVNI